MYASLLLGQDSHKEVNNYLLRFYYWKPVLFVVCAGTESWYMALYTLAFASGPPVLGVPVVPLALALCTPFFAFKQVANAVQMYVACQALVDHDVKAKAKAKK